MTPRGIGALAVVLVLAAAACTPPAPAAPGSPAVAVSPGVDQATPSVAPASGAVPSPSAAVAHEARNATLRWAFTQAGDHPDVLLADGIAAAAREIDAALYAINRPADVQALASAQGRCHCVRLISDATQTASDARQVAALQQLQAVGTPILVDSHSGLMHMKVLEIDRRTVYEGSFNVTNNASTVNDEILVRVDSTAFAEATAAEFETMWTDPRRFKPWPLPAGTATPVAVPEF
jgi:phosphatidylserine/phosphatidylglycerophosphate/cardiolipin synthase-like enzyme